MTDWATQWYEHERQKRQRFVDKARRKAAKRRLFAVDPHCCQCGKLMRNGIRDGHDAACLVGDRLACRACAQTVSRIDEFYAAGGWG